LDVRDTPSLQAAVDSLPSWGGEIYLAAGTYEVASPGVTIKKNNVSIRGEGPLATYIRSKDANPTYDLIRVTRDASNVGDFFRMSDLTIDGRGTSPGASSALVIDSTGTAPLIPNCSLDNVIITGARNNCLHLKAIIKFVAVNCSFLSSRTDGIRIEGAPELVECNLIACHMQNNAGKGVLVSGNVTSLLFFACGFDSNGSSSCRGIDLSGLTIGLPRIQIIGCHFEPTGSNHTSEYINLVNAPGTTIDSCYFNGGDKILRAIVVGPGSLGTRVTNNTGYLFRESATPVAPPLPQAAVLAEFQVEGVEFGNIEIRRGPVQKRARIAASGNGFFYGGGGAAEPAELPSGMTSRGVAFQYSYGAAGVPDATIVPHGSMIWRSDLNELHVNINGTWRKVTTT
jgi:hypothetical protein